MAPDQQNASRFSPLDYGEVEKDLPEFTSREELLRGVEFPFEDLLSQEQKSIRTLLTLQGSFALHHIDKLIADYVMGKVEQLDFSGGHGGAEDETITHARIEAALRDRSWGEIKEDSSEQFAVVELLVKANQLKFQLIEKWLDSCDNHDLGSVGETEFRKVLPAMAATDKWFLKMIVRKTPIPVAQRKESGFTNPFSVLADRDGETVEIPFHEAFPEEFEVMLQAYRDLVSELTRLKSSLELGMDGSVPNFGDLIDRKVAYYEALISALNSSDEALWYAADALLPGQIRDDGDMIHIHTIEEAYGRDPVARVPETSLRVPDRSDDAVKAQTIANQTKARMLRSLNSSRLQDLIAVQQTVSLTERSNAVLRHFLGTGFEHFLKPAGQILPNHAEPRTKGGVDSSLDISSTERRWKEKEKAVVATFGRLFFEKIVLPRKDIHKEIGAETTSHELGHSVGILPDTNSRLGGVEFINRFIEEWKATVGGAVCHLIIPLWDNTGEVTLEDAKDWIISKLAMACRFALLRHRPGGVMYFRKSMMLVNLMQKHDLLISSGEGEFPWEIKLDDNPKVESFLKELFDQYREVLRLYGEGTEDGLRDFLGENLTSSPFLEFLCDQIKFEGSEVHTPEKISTLPAKAAPKSHIQVEGKITEITRDGVVTALK